MTMARQENIYTLDLPADLSLKDVADLLTLFQPHIDAALFNRAPANVRRLFKPSVFSESPSNMLN
jgi:hypothetical protein